MDTLVNQDYEYEYLRDDIYALERQKDIEASWQQWEEEQKRQPAKIIYHENHTRKLPFRRVIKKILLFRSHLSTTNDSSRIRHPGIMQGEY